MNRLVSLFSAILLTTVAAAQSTAGPAAPRLQVKATGQAPSDLPSAREAAIEAALRRCVEAAGVEIRSISRVEDFVLVMDIIESRTAGYVESYKVLQENPDQDGLYTVRVSAVVSSGKMAGDIDVFAALLKRKGRPRMIVLGSANGELLDAYTESLVQRDLERRGIGVVDASVVNELRRKEALRTAKGDGNHKKAAIIAGETGAHFLVLVQIEQAAGEREVIYGLESYSAEAMVLVKIIEADSGLVLGSEIAETRGEGETQRAALRAATATAAESVMTLAMERVAEHWFEDVDQRGGAEIVVALHGMDYRRVSGLISTLRQVDGVKDVFVDSIDPEAVGYVRVITNAPPANVAAVLLKLDSGLKVKKISGNRIDLTS